MISAHYSLSREWRQRPCFGRLPLRCVRSPLITDAFPASYAEVPPSGARPAESQEGRTIGRWLFDGDPIRRKERNEQVSLQASSNPGLSIVSPPEPRTQQKGNQATGIGCHGMEMMKRRERGFGEWHEPRQSTAPSTIRHPRGVESIFSTAILQQRSLFCSWKPARNSS